MSCPKCGSGNIAKEKTMRGWSGDYVCCDCGYNDSKDAFGERGKNEFVKINKEKHTTIIMVTHDSFVASYSKKVYYMKDGHLDLSIDCLNKTQDDYYKEIVKVTTQMHL